MWTAIWFSPCNESVFSHFASYEINPGPCVTIPTGPSLFPPLTSQSAQQSKAVITVFRTHFFPVKSLQKTELLTAYRRKNKLLTFLPSTIDLSTFSILSPHLEMLHIAGFLSTHFPLISSKATYLSFSLWADSFLVVLRGCNLSSPTRHHSSMDQALGSLRSILQYLIISEQEPQHFHFALGRTNCAAVSLFRLLGPQPNAGHIGHPTRFG